jgi:hypothetical protein
LRSSLSAVERRAPNGSRAKLQFGNAAEHGALCPFDGSGFWKNPQWGLVFTIVLAVLIVLGSRRLAHVDAALVGYTFATLFATFGITYRYAMWLQRPPTAAITFPLVFGWIHFEPAPGRLDTYQTFLFGIPAGEFPIDSFMAFVIFHGLVWASYLVIAGVMLAFRRRMIDHGAAAVQQFGEDVLPLILLCAISVTGLMLSVSYTKG